MTVRARVAICIVGLAVAISANALAGTKRIAVVVGNNAGNSDQQPLHYAEADATRFARVLLELGGVAPDDLVLLEGKGLDALTDAFARAQRRIAEFRRDPANRIIVLFYFSGHSDGEAIELGRDRLSFSDLRKWLAGAGADVRVALVDSCKSGALLAAKGGAPGAAFQIRLTDDLASTGEALLTSSAADEVALESSEIGGSFFTNHFISALRGAADTSGTGVVTLNEAYRYAYAHTIATTGETIIGPQHPAYDYRLTGQGELVLAELSKPTASLVLPTRFDRILVIEPARDQVIAEIRSDAHNVIAVQPGHYRVRAWRDGHVFSAAVTVATGDRRIVSDNELSIVDSQPTTSKGGAPLEARWSMLVAGGGEAGIANGVGVVPGGRVELRTGPSWSLAAVVGSRHRDDFRETSSLLLAGYRRSVARDGFAAWGGLEAGPGFVIQSEISPTAYTGTFAAGIFAGASRALTSWASIAIEATLPALLLRRDDQTSIVALPAGWVGVVVTL